MSHTPCEKKKAYRSQAKARQAMRRTRAIARANGFTWPLEVYPCREGDHWHITTTPPPEKRSA